MHSRPIGWFCDRGRPPSGPWHSRQVSVSRHTWSTSGGRGDGSGLRSASTIANPANTRRPAIAIRCVLFTAGAGAYSTRRVMSTGTVLGAQKPLAVTQ